MTVVRSSETLHAIQLASTSSLLRNCWLLLAGLHEALSDGVTIDVSAACRPLVAASHNSNLSQHCGGGRTAYVCADRQVLWV